MMATRLFIASIFIAACGDNIHPELDASVEVGDGASATCVANTVTCVGDSIVTCGPTGTPTATTLCDLGCDAATTTCTVMAPSNLASTTCTLQASVDLVVSASQAIDTNSGCSTVITQAN